MTPVAEKKAEHSGEVPEVVLNQLYKFTPLQTSFGMNMLAINGGRPMMMNLKDIIAAFIEFREEVIRRRTIYELNKARDRAHTLVGLALAVENLDPEAEPQLERWLYELKEDENAWFFRLGFTVQEAQNILNS